MSQSSSVIGLQAGRVFDKSVMDDLAASGLRPQDMRIRELNDSLRATSRTGPQTPGYVIPYYTVESALIPEFYRVKILRPDLEAGLKYKQPRGSNNHIYFPPGLKDCLLQWLNKFPSLRTIIITEGEKKAASSVARGVPAVGLGGVDSWRSRTVLLPKDTTLTTGKKDIKAKLPAGAISVPEMQTLAFGFASLMDLIVQFNLTPVIVFDSDRNGTLKSEVQRAATMLAYEFRYLGVPSNRIKQIILPEISYQERLTSRSIPLDEDLDEKAEAGRKTGLDDYLVIRGVVPLIELLQKVGHDQAAFPKHPNAKGFINVALEGSLSRRESFQVAAVVLSELDARGKRLRDEHTGQPFYYDGVSHRLMPAKLLDYKGDLLHETPFGTLLYQEFSLTANDRKVLTWLASQFTGEEPISEVSPKRVLTLITDRNDPSNPHGIAWQASDSQFFAISHHSDPKKGIQLVDNGTYGILFEQNQVQPLDVDLVLEHVEELSRDQKVAPWWYDTIQQSNVGKSAEDIVNSGGLSDRGKLMRLYAVLLYYTSPFLQRWRGIQLPVELITGEAGSGKSSLYSLRLAIISGRPHLRNPPTDIRDWQASVANAGGMHVTDNVHFGNRELKQRLSDELCRIVTEPNPAIEQRKLYTNADLLRIPVNTTFAFTSIQMPFSNSDIMQRSAIFECCALGREPEGEWVPQQLDFRGGREAWVAHHLVFLHRIIRLASRSVEQGGWNPNFRTTHRLAHFEQCLTLAGKVLGLQTEFVSRIIGSTQTRGLLSSDWTAEGLRAFCDAMRTSGVTQRVTTGDIAAWCETQDGHSENQILTNAHKLGRYLGIHRSTIQYVTGLTYVGMKGTTPLYEVHAARYDIDQEERGAGGRR